jgi:antitoxin CptB
MTMNPEARRKRLFFRCHHTGMKENDLLIGAFARRHLGEMSDDEVAWLEAFLMEQNDIDIYEWITGRKPVPAECEHPVLRMLMRSVLRFGGTAPAEDEAAGRTF